MTMHRSLDAGQLRRVARRVLALVVLTTIAFQATPVQAGSKRTLAQALAAGWDCDPPILLLGHYHCSPPGRPSVADIIAGGVDSPSIVHQVFRPDGRLAGTEILIRADLFAGQRCPTDEWLPVPPFGEPQYYACHNFDI
jgi:hypothetical protein